MPTPAPTLPLDDVRVLDLSQRLGAYCTKLLADAGADVVKVEPPDGDVLRATGPFQGDVRDPERSLPFAFYHASKRCVRLDLADQRSVPALAALARECDVIVLSPAGHAPVPGFDPATGQLAWAPEAAVVCAITPFGLTGPYRGLRATEFTAQAAGGLMYGCGPAEGPPRGMPGQQLTDMAGTHAAIAILHALAQRPAHGGQLIDIAVHEVAAAMSVDLYLYTSSAEILRRRGPIAPAWGGTFQAADGPVELTFATDKHWRGLLDLLGQPPELTDPALFNPALRVAHGEQIRAAIARFLGPMDRSPFVDLCQQHAIPATPINTVGEFAEHPHTKAREFIVGHHRDQQGELRMPRPPFITTPAISASYRTAAPALGADDPAAIAAQWAQRGPAGPRPGDGAVKPLRDVRILSFGAIIAGSLCASYLGELGADVIKIESPLVPDNARRTRRGWEGDPREPSGTETSAMYANYNRNVRSLALNLKDPAQFAVLLDLVPQADVIIENYSPGVIDRWGLTPERIRSVNPRAVLISLSGFGQTGPCRDYLLYGATGSSFCGLSRAFGFVHQAHNDYVSAAHGIFAVLSALRARDRTGTGVRIDLAQTEAAATLMAPLLVDYLANGRDWDAPISWPPGTVFTDVVPCDGDDRWLAVEAETAADWRRLAQCVGQPDLGDPAPDGAAVDRMRAALRSWAAGRTPHQAMLQLQRAGVAAGAVQNGEDLSVDPQLRHRQVFTEVTSPDLGTIEYPRAPYQLSKTPARISRPAPRLGQHSAEILADWLAR